MAEAASMEERLDRAVELEASGKADEAVVVLEELVTGGGDDASVIEQSIYKLGEILTAKGDAEALGGLLKKIRPFFATISKAKTEKIVRELINLVGNVPDSLNIQLSLCKECIDWALEEKRTFLRQRLQSRLADLYFQLEQFQAALEIMQPLLSEVKRLDDKHLLIEIHLTETRVQHKLRNLPKAKASLTAARTHANSVHITPRLQGEIDMESGMLHCQEHDYKTAYSYFFEAFEGFNSQDQPEAVTALKYMLLAKVMTNNPEDVHSILSGKLALKYQGRDMEAMNAVAHAHKERSLEAFEQALSDYKSELGDDPLISKHVAELYDTMLQQNLCRIIEPFSRVEIAHVAKLIGLEVALVEKKLSQMILDKRFKGILDQGSGCLTLFHDPPTSGVYDASLETIKAMSLTVDRLFERAKHIT
eukprot:TRINITY_DN635_c0_g1_i1.p1 TRINITY_DN635_c0_g1~~TRINITY_DN635_c0_g1_i1.p1  ORF type:complete len:420 (+),score=164.48 TRINITY_DN635_c0_g1_i1:155-1414(+)